MLASEIVLTTTLDLCTGLNPDGSRIQEMVTITTRADSMMNPDFEVTEEFQLLIDARHLSDIQEAVERSRILAEGGDPDAPIAEEE